MIMNDSDAADVAELLPLSPAVYHVLLGLGRETLHGYAIMQSFQRLTGGVERLLPGTLYATLARMVEAGILMEAEPPEDDADARRRYYRATEFGRSLAAAESRRLQRLLDIARAQHLAAEPTS
jgi:DNA-binding PadR family transcriptional regulator